MGALDELSPREISVLLRGEPETIGAWTGQWNVRRFALHVAVIVAGTGLYGAAMGWWRDPQQALLRGRQVSAHHPADHGRQRAAQRHARAVAGLEHSVSSVLLGHFDEFHHHGGHSRRVQSVDGVHGLERAADVAAKDISGSTYSFIKLTHVVAIAFAGMTGNARLFQLLAQLGGSRTVARRVLFAWLAVNLFLGSQLSWILRPFIGSPALPVEFVRTTAFHGNFFENVFHSLLQIFQQFD